jgi:aryl-alcohol dehydrogenase-like predicted oxidoreductase
VTPFADQKKTTPDQIALAWLLAKKPWIVPIPGTTRLERLEENLGAMKVQQSSEGARDLENASSQIELKGSRSSELHE